MNTTVLIIMLSTAALLVFLGFMIKYKKIYWTISGYNTMTDEEKSHVDKEKMGNATAVSIFIISGLVAVGGLFMYFNMDTIGIVSIMLILPVTLVSVALSQRYYNDGYKEEKSSTVFVVIGLGFFFTLILILVFSTLFTGSRQNKYIINNGVLDISGSYGEQINISEITDLQLKDSLPGNLYKTYGFNLNTVLKGHFRSDMGNVVLYVDTSKPPFIYINDGGDLTILNDSSSEKTKELYNKLKVLIQK